MGQSHHGVLVTFEVHDQEQNEDQEKQKFCVGGAQNDKDCI